VQGVVQRLTLDGMLALTQRALGKPGEDARTFEYIATKRKNIDKFAPWTYGCFCPEPRPRLCAA
jgi:hypothetical protein